MSEHLIPPELVPPGVNDARSRAFAAAFGEVLAEFSTASLVIQDAWTVDARLLPAMVVEAGMSDYVSPGMREEHVRALIDDAPAIHALAGLVVGVRRAFAALGVTLEWRQWYLAAPKGAPNTHVVTAYAGDTILAGEEMLFSAASQAALTRIMHAAQRWSQGIDFRVGLRTQAAGAMIGCITLGGCVSTSAVAVAEEA